MLTTSQNRRLEEKEGGNALFLIPPLGTGANMARPEPRRLNGAPVSFQIS
jgi:hypothetical protein